MTPVVEADLQITRKMTFETISIRSFNTFPEEE
jgi:hypothetical protein